MSSLASAVTRSFQSDRLRLARTLRGLSQKELAAAVEVSPPTMSQYESGAITPPGDVLARLSFALGCNREFFYRQRIDPAGTPFFRSLRSTPQRERERARSYAKFVAEVVNELERFVELPDTSFDVGIRLDDDDAVEAAERAADVLREHWGLPAGPVGHVVRTLEHHGAVTAAIGSFDERLDAFTLRFRTRPIVVLCSMKGVATRRRFDAAHELAHLVLHDEPQEVNKLQEAQAHRFASAFLMPAHDVDPWLVRSPGQLDVLEAGAEVWGVSMQALLRRAKDVGTLSDSGYTRAMQRMSALGWRTREPIDIGPPERPQLLERALQTAAQAGFSLSAVADTIGMPASRLLRLLALPEDLVDVDASVVSINSAARTG